MKKFQFKLVRDKIPDHMKAQGQHIEGLSELPDLEYMQELQKKVVEEAKELGAADTIEELKEEIADVQEVLDYLKTSLNMEEAEVKALQQKKIAKNGAFDQRQYIECVKVDEESQWCVYYLDNPEKFPQIPESA